MEKLENIKKLFSIGMKKDDVIKSIKENKLKIETFIFHREFSSYESINIYCKNGYITIDFNFLKAPVIHDITIDFIHWNRKQLQVINNL